MNDDTIFYVLELQTDVTGAVLVSVYDNLPQAESRFYAILSAAAISQVRKHGAIIMNDDGVMLKHEIFTHKVETPAEE